MQSMGLTSGNGNQPPPLERAAFNLKQGEIMRIQDLIEQLEDYKSEHGADAEVRLMTQQNWPFENGVYGLCDSSELEEEEEEDEDRNEDESKPIIYIVEGRQICYGNKNAWDAAQ